MTLAYEAMRCSVWTFCCSPNLFYLSTFSCESFLYAPLRCSVWPLLYLMSIVNHHLYSIATAMWPLLHLIILLQVNSWTSRDIKWNQIFFSITFGQVFSAESAVPLIIDTDASFDVDDVVAICMAHALMDNGEVMSMILITLMISNKMMIPDLIEHCKENEWSYIVAKIPSKEHLPNWGLPEWGSLCFKQSMYNVHWHFN